MVPTRPVSRASKESNSQCTITPYETGSSERISRPLSRTSSERHPRGPRTPSPLPPKSPRPLSPDMQQSDPGMSAPIPRPSGIPRSKRQPLYPTGNTDASRTATTSTVNSVEPLSIKKKTSVRGEIPVSPTPRKHPHIRTSPLPKANNIPRRASPTTLSNNTTKPEISPQNPLLQDIDRVFQLSKATKEDVSSR